MYVKVYDHGSEVLVAVCDEELLGKTLREGDLVMEIREAFYKGDLMNHDSLEGLFGEASILNLVGNDVVDKAVSGGFVDADSVLEIAGVKHAQVVEI
ncbi:MAG: hypothetical protein B6U72_06440 [Candidatus Altiarchaeales archaeon ex4484_2]|nr:MAG: hypothetical protein B6U72_06440 [Candidatus Altiarchaeales archaeon ex4484_2]